MAKQFATFAGDKLRISTVLPGLNWTVMAWVKWNSSTAAVRPWFYRYNNSGAPYCFSGLNSSGVLIVDFQFGTVGGGGSAVITGSTLTVGQWYHVALVMQGQVGSLYMNGVLVGTATDTKTSVSQSNDMLFFGHEDDADAGTGLNSICCVKMWDGLLLTGEEIQAEMASARADLRNQLYLEAPLISGVELADTSGRMWDTMAGTITDPDEPPWVEMYPAVRRRSVKSTTTAYTIAVNAGSYGITGTAITLRRGYPLAATAGSYSLTGTAVTLRRGYPLAVGIGSYALTGQNVTLRWGHVATVGIGSYALTGSAVTLRRGYPIAVTPGSYALTGSAVTLRRGYPLAVGIGSYTLTGSNVALRWGHALTVGIGSYALTGSAVTLRRGYPLAVGVGSYSLSGQDVTLRWGHNVTVGIGSYALTGTAVTLKRGYPLAVGIGSYALTGQNVTLRWGHTLAVGIGSYSLTGSAVTLRRGYPLLALAGSYALTGSNVALRWAHALPVDVGDYNLTGSDVVLRTGSNPVIGVDAGSYSLTGQNVTLAHGSKLAAGAGSYALTGQSVGLAHGWVIQTGAGSYNLTGQSVTLRATHSLTVDAGAYTITGQDVTPRWGHVLGAASGAYGTSGQNVTLTWPQGINGAYYFRRFVLDRRSKMPRLIQAGETNATRRQVYFHLVQTDGITAAVLEVGEQPQISVDGTGWVDVGITTLLHIGEGRYYAELDPSVIEDAGVEIETRYKSVRTAECPGDSVLVVAYDPYEAISDIKAKTDTLSSGLITTLSPVSRGGTISLVRGDDYRSEDGRALSWTGTSVDVWPDLTSAAITLTIGALEATGEVTSPTGTQNVRVELAADDTEDLPVGRYPYSVRAEQPDGDVITLAQGVAVVSD